jgi:hypothetical protein
MILSCGFWRLLCFTSINRILHLLILLDNDFLNKSYSLEGIYDFKLWPLEAF